MTAAIATAAGLLGSACDGFGTAYAGTTRKANSTSSLPRPEVTVELSESQLAAIKIEPVGTYPFAVEKEGIGSIDFDNNVYFDSNLSVPVFPSHEGTITKTLVELGDEVQKGQPLYLIESPDLARAESALISAAGNLERTNEQRMRSSAGGLPQKEFEQVLLNQQAAEHTLREAQEAVRAFGKSEAEIAQILASRKIDSELVVRSPVSGQVSSVNATPGLLVQPGKAPAPCSVADVSTKWMLAKVAESDSPFFRVGQPVKVTVIDYPHRVFNGKVSKIYPSVDPLTHRVTIRARIGDAGNALRSGMLAEFSVQVARPVESIAVPPDSVVREGDGTLTAWATADRHRFMQRIVTTGLRRNGHVQILSGLSRGELVVTEGAIFLDNMLQAPPSD